MNEELAKTIILINEGIKNSNYPEDRILAEKYLAILAPILAKVVIRENAIDDFESFERFHGNSWLRNDKPFGNFYSHWSNFRSNYKESI